ncbi:Toxin co-regulated pilus biosynthesis protein Q [Edwardsiella tarda]|nr:Toxin co-regulated pilus biosynthesis protein Q [Edwardsiella tarda]
MMKIKFALTLILVSLSVSASPIKPDVNMLVTPGKSPFSVDRQDKELNKDSVEDKGNINVNVTETNSFVRNKLFSITLNENTLLSQEINRWAIAQNYKLLWSSDKDYIIFNTVKFEGKSKNEILQSLGNLFASEQYNLVLKLYTGNNVLVVDSI